MEPTFRTPSLQHETAVPSEGAPRSHAGEPVQHQGPAFQQGQPHPDEELEDPAQGGSGCGPALLVRQIGPRLFQPPPRPRQLPLVHL